MKKLDLFGPVYSGYDECINAKSVSAFLKTLEGNEEFEVFINSPGGSVFEGLAIYNLLKEYSSRMTIKVIGEASSIASVITCASDRVLIAESAMMLIHNPWTFSIVDEAYIKKLQKNLSTIKDSITKVYARKTGLSAQELSDIMAEGDYHNAEDCVKLKLADEVYVPNDDEQAITTASNQVVKNLMNKHITMNLDINKFNINLEQFKEEYSMTIEQLQAENEALKNSIATKEGELRDVKAQIDSEMSSLKATVAELNQFKMQAEQEIAAKTQDIWLKEEQAFCNQLIQDKKLTRAELMGTAKEGENPAKVVKLLKLRNLDEELYKAEREEMQAKPSIEALTEGFGNESHASTESSSLADYIKNKSGSK